MRAVLGRSMSYTILKHSLAEHILSRLRDVGTDPETYRRLTKSISQLLITEAARDLPTKSVTIQTPLEATSCKQLADDLVVIPVLRAGLGMLEAALDILPGASVGYLGLERNEETSAASAYYSKLPEIKDKMVILLDPMLATGGSAEQALDRIYSGQPKNVKLVCIVAAPEGMNLLETRFPQLDIICAALDRELNSKKYILPGLGDFGDRLYGT